MASDTHSRVAQALLQAVGQPESILTDLNPATDEQRKAVLGAASEIMIVSPSPYWGKPGEKTGQLKIITSTAKNLTQQIEALDGPTRSAINRAGSPRYQRMNQIQREFDEPGADIGALLAEQSALADNPEPQDQWCTPVTLAALHRFISAAEYVFGKLEAVPKKRGGVKNVAAHNVTLIVGQYWLKTKGGPLKFGNKKRLNPFRRLLAEIFGITKIDADTEAPVRSAIKILNEGGGGIIQ